CVNMDFGNHISEKCNNVSNKFGNN
ncbi:unnamed protein product, partial [Allacma fusca]